MDENHRILNETTKNAVRVNNDEEKNESEEEFCSMDVHQKSRAPDGGWGWMVAMGTLIINTLFFSLPFAFGILFSGFLLSNGISSTITAAIYNLYLVLWNLSMILANPLCQEFGLRTIGFTGVVMASLSLILSGFSPSPYFLFFSFSFLGGVSTGVSVGISHMVLPPYFNKRSGQANTFLVAGAPVSQMVFPPFIRYLLDEYSFKGAALIHGSILLNGLIGVSFFHPVKWHLRAPSKEKESPQHNAHESLALNHPSFPSKACSPLPPEAISLMPRNTRYNNECEIQGSLSMSISSIISAVSEVQVGLSFLSEEKEVTKNMKPQVNIVWKTFSRVAGRIKTDVTMLRQFRCVILAVTVMLTQTTFLNFIMMLPFVAKAADHSLQDAAGCIAVLGVTNLVTRLVVSPLSDNKKFSIRFSIMLGYFLRASGIAVALLASELWEFIASGVLTGMGLGFSLSMFNLVIVHYMGLENLSASVGIIGLVAALGFPTFGPLIGMIRDATNNYSTSLSILVALDLFSVGLWFLMPAAQARDARRSQRDPDGSSDNQHVEK